MEGRSFSQCVDDVSVQDTEPNLVTKFHILVSAGPDYV